MGQSSGLEKLHDDQRMYLHAFVRLAIPETVQHDIPVDATGEPVDPFHNGEGEKVHGLLIADTVARDMMKGRQRDRYAGNGGQPDRVRRSERRRRLPYSCSRGA